MDTNELSAIGEAVKEVLDERLTPITERLEAAEEALKGMGKEKPTVEEVAKAAAEAKVAEEAAKAAEAAKTDEDKKAEAAKAEAAKTAESELSDDVKEAIESAVKGKTEELEKTVTALKEGITKFVGAKKSLDDTDGGKTEETDSGRDAWGRRVHTKARS